MGESVVSGEEEVVSKVFSDFYEVYYRGVCE